MADKADLAAKLVTATDQLEADETAAKLQASEAQAATQKRNETEADFASAMDEVAGDVERETDYNGPQMQDIGYELASTNRASAEMTKVSDVQLSPGDYPGQLHAQ